VKKNITYIISNIDKAIAFEWIVERLSKEKFSLSFLLLNPGSSFLHDYLERNNIPVKTVRYRGKKDALRAFLATVAFLKKQRSDMVHCHLFDAGVIGLAAASLLGIKDRIYTRHHSSFHHTYHKHAVKYDLFINRRATHIIAITSIVRDILIEQEKVPPSKVSLIHHGFTLEKFEHVSAERIAALKNKYGLGGVSPVIGVISRLTEWKGIQYIIAAFKRLLLRYPDARLMIFNARGNYKTEIMKLLEEIPATNYQLVPFENDLFAMYHLFDLFVHVPVDFHIEAFGQIYIEAMAAGIPSIFTLSGIACEIVKHENNALVVPYRNSEAIYTSMLRLLEDKDLCNKLVINAKETVQKRFSIEKMISNLELLYSR